MTPPDKCPRCGASRVIRIERTDAAFACGSQTQFSQRGFHESWDCVIRQRDQLAARVKELEEAITILAAFGSQLDEELDPPPRNCSCHICPPCADCESWESQRVAKQDWKQALERAAKARESKP